MLKFAMFFCFILFFIKGEMTIEPGTYTYPFQVQLPLGVPTSLEAEHGHIRYGMQVVLNRPRWADQKFEETFTVIKPLNLNHDLTLRVIFISHKFPQIQNQLRSFFPYYLQHPTVAEEIKRFNPFCLFVCCASDPLFMIAKLPVSGYTAGQMINVDLELTNASNENIKSFTVQIVRVSFIRSAELTAPTTVGCWKSVLNCEFAKKKHRFQLMQSVDLQMC